MAYVFNFTKRSTLNNRLTKNIGGCQNSKIIQIEEGKLLWDIRVQTGKQLRSLHEGHCSSWGQQKKGGGHKK